jgi:signal transduction histidine kinase
MPVVQKIMAEGVPYSYEDYFPPPVDKYFRFTSVPLGEYFITTGAEITGIKKAHDDLKAANSAMRESRAAAMNLMQDAVEARQEAEQAEKELLKTNEELEMRVKERTENLADTVEALLVEIKDREIAEENVKRLNRLYAVLSETNQTIVRTKDREYLFNEFCRIAVEDGGFILSWAGLIDEENGEVKRVAANGETGYLDDVRITVNEEPTGLGPTGISIREGNYYICNDFQNDPCTRPWHDQGKKYGIFSSASIAIKENDRVIGALTLYGGVKDYFDELQVELLLQMGMDISFALDNLIRESSRMEAENALYEETAERLKAVETLRENERMLIQQSRQAAMGEMIGNIAHQWRQPLNTLGLYTQRLGMFYGSPGFNKEFLDNSIAKSMEIIKHMSKTIDDFRDYFKPEKEKADFYVIETIKSSMSLLEGNLNNPKIAIDLVEHDNPVISGYQNEFSQVFLNILNNARDAIIERGIADARVIITICSEDNCAVVTVADNAGGIPDEVISKVFDPYFTTKGPQIGTGIGLFMSKSIIEKNMGGRLTVRNTDSGAEFRIEVEHGIRN